MMSWLLATALCSRISHKRCECNAIIKQSILYIILKTAPIQSSPEWVTSRMVCVCCDPRLFVVPSLVMGCPMAGCHTLDDPSASDDHQMTSHWTAQTSGWRPSTQTNQNWRLTVAEYCFRKRIFRNLNNICENFHWISSGLNGVAIHFNGGISFLVS